MAVNIKILQETMKELLQSTYLTEQTDLEVKRFIETGDLNQFSSTAKKELSFLYGNLIFPIYMSLDKTGYLPNIFGEMEN